MNAESGPRRRADIEAKNPYARPKLPTPGCGCSSRTHSWGSSGLLSQFHCSLPPSVTRKLDGAGYFYG